MSTDPHGTGTTAAGPGAQVGARDPFQRYGWITWFAWTGFLAFPVVNALQAGAPGWARWAVVAVTLLFGVAYVVSTARLSRAPRSRPRRESTLVLALLVAVVLPTVPVLGLGILSFFPYWIAFGVFALARPWCWAWAGALVTVGLVLPLVSGQAADWGFFSLILAGVTAATCGGRLMSDHAVSHARLQQELSVTGERERVARDVHDGLGHSLTVVSVKAELAARLLDVDPDRARTELVEIQSMTRQALAELRATVVGLRSTGLDEELAGVCAALESAGIAPVLTGDPTAVDPRRRTVAAWVLREAVTNVVRHSGASSCEVVLDTELVRVSDDGAGSDDLVAGRGLRGLRERVGQSGGELAVSRCPRTGGTVLEVTW